MKVKAADLPAIARLAGCKIETRPQGIVITRGIDRRVLVGPGGYLLRTTLHPAMSYRIRVPEALEVLQVTERDIAKHKESRK